MIERDVRDTAALDALNAALRSGDVDEVLGYLAPGAVVWHNDDKIEIDAAENMKRLPGLHQLVDGLDVDIVQCSPTPSGWLQQFVLRGTVRSSGNALAAHNCVVVHVAAGLITRIDEYVDPTFGAQLGF
jgi:ketosteroid isomerase-like protein